MANNEFFMASDNLIQVTGLRDAVTGGYINDASVKMSLFLESVLNPNAEAVTDKGSGKVGIPATGHGRSADDYIRLEGFDNYDGEYEIDSVSANEIVIVATYVQETLSGTEQIYVGVPFGTDISLTYVDGSDGNYQGVLPDTLKGLIERNWYFLFITAIKDTSRLTSKLKWKAVYHLSTVSD